MTVVSNDEVREVQEKLIQEGHGEEKAKVAAEVLDVKKNKVFGFSVKHGVTVWNVLAIPFTAISIMILNTYVNAQTIFLLEDPDMFNIDKKNIGVVTSQLSLWGYPFAIVGTFTSGYIYDIFGRRLTLFVAFFFASILVFTIPYSSPHLIPNLFIIRILFQICMTAPVTSPLIADYFQKESIGKASSVIGLGYVIGEVVSMGILFRITANMSPYWGFALVSFIGFGVATVFLFIVKEPLLRKKEKP